ncbi:flagellar basal-body MS-ring/collar protein FliF [Nocardioides sp. Arc9.136]|uniref:flagellar basal-body MS-ring/collar protein FliF n=1 Tax=Nocardioides sp. Arc9.136 TaxID=2996826 RepID=UPI0026654FFF|nr:flagellar basal-body MS-ring/collar protein FliF [Nocardioides sp. Arc9.136]WKN47616.1 flagellar basal-body MS-ring/collar protein FliF [Nocardioides sp. Arc9.136]
MKQNVTRFLQRAQQGFAAFTTGQKVVAVIGTVAVLLGGFMVFQWAARPSMAPLYHDLSTTDASAVVEQLEAQGTPYELAGDGTTVMVPRDLVRATRIDMSGEGLPSGSDGGYSLLDDQGLTTSDFKERTDYKRAMEGELSATIESIDGVETAVVHLAIPEKEVFEEEQVPTTASVLVDTRSGSTLDPGQVQAVVNLVASSIDGLEPEQVTVADATGKVLSTPGGAAGTDGTARAQMVADVQEEYRARLQSMLDRVVGPGNSTVQVSAELDFDKAVSETVEYDAEAEALPLSSSETDETYDGAAAGGVTGVVGPDGQMDPAAGGAADGSGSYRKSETTRDNAVGSRSERRESTPGAIEKLSIGVVVDSMSAQQANETDIRELVMGTAGISRQRGDSLAVASLPFDRSAEEAAAAALAEEKAAEAAASRNRLIRNAVIGLLVIGALVFLAFRSRRRARRREEETTYIVEQLRERRQAQAALEPSPALLALEESEASRADDLRDELTDLIERQPDDVAALLRGWLTERP